MSGRILINNVGKNEIYSLFFLILVGLSANEKDQKYFAEMAKYAQKNFSTSRCNSVLDLNIEDSK